MSRWTSFPKLLPGDWVIVAAGLLAVAALFTTLWHPEQAAKLQIRSGDHVHATYSLDQDRIVEIAGPQGTSRIAIQHGQVRFLSSPCSNQYCVHQGWLRRAGQIAICLPNQVSLELLGSEKPYDSLNY